MGYPASKYCPDCRVEAERERNRKYKRNGSARKIGSTDLCEKCGKEYIVTSGLQKYCPECAKEQKRRLQAIYDYKRGEGNVESFIKPKTEKK